MVKSLRVSRLRLALAFVVLLTSVSASAQRQFILQTASGALTAATTTDAPNTAFSTAIIFLDVTTITTPDADDEIDFYVQTTYDDGTTWTDVENVHFDTTDDGNTAQRIIVIDGAKDGPGTIQSITGTDPAAGAEISETVPANTIWFYRSCRFTLVTDATAATREVHLILDDGTNTLLNLPATGTQIASLTRNYNAHELGGLIVPTGNEIDIGLPSNVVMSSGYRLVSETTLLKVGDNYGAPQLNVEAWHDPSVSTDAAIGDTLKSYDRPLGSQIRIKAAVTGATAPTYAFSARGVFR